MPLQGERGRNIMGSTFEEEIRPLHYGRESFGMLASAGASSNNIPLSALKVETFGKGSEVD